MRNIPQHVAAIIDRPINVLEIARKIKEGEIEYVNDGTDMVLEHIGQVRDGISTISQIATEKTLGENRTSLNSVQERLRIDDGELDDIINCVRYKICDYVAGDYVRSVVSRDDANAISLIKEAIEEKVPDLSEIIRFGFNIDEVVTRILSEAAERKFSELERENQEDKE